MNRSHDIAFAMLLLAVLGAGCAGQIEPGTDSSPEQGAGLSEALTEASCPPAVPSALAVPAGNKLGFAYDADGDQVYECRSSGAGFAWTLKAPDADLFNVNSGSLSGSHYAGPTWEHIDGSSVVGAKLAGATVDPTAVAWLLVGATSHGGDGRMSHVSFIQRLRTAGGLAPAGGCDAEHQGAIAPVHYTATYYFFVPNAGQAGGSACK